MYCRKCGTKLNEGANFCTKCGTNTIGKIVEQKVKEEVKIEPKVIEIEEKEEKIESKANNIIVLIIVVLTMLVAIGLIIGFNYL